MTGIETIDGHDCGAAEREIMAERTRADAAEAQRDRLAAALEYEPCRCYYRWSGDPPVERRVTCNRCAALADVQEEEG